MSTGWEWIERGLRIARRRRVTKYRESPEDIKFCEICGEYQVLPDDEAVAGPLNLVYHRICPICADVHKAELVEMTKQWIRERIAQEQEMVGDAT